MAIPIHNLVGQRFGELEVLGQDLEMSKLKKKVYWKCRCSCGREKSVRLDGLKKIRTCGECTIDLTNRQFGQLTVEGRAGVDSFGHRIWICRCTCGNRKEVLATSLVEGLTQSCGCLHSQLTHKATFKDLGGLKFGKLTPETYIIQNGKVKWKCLCDCGNFTWVTRANLVSGHTASCGCLTGSVGEETIANILRNNNITFEREKVFTNLPNRRFDFYLPDFNRIIEFDGRQHFKKCSWYGDDSDFERAKARDAQKTNYCLANKITLVRIPYTERDTITLDLILSDKYLIKENTNDNN